MTWNQEDYYVDIHYNPTYRYLATTGLWGPKDVTVNAITSGKYEAKGTYDLTGSSIANGEIELGINGTTTTYNSDIVENTYVIPSGQLSGSYDVTLEIPQGAQIQGYLCVCIRVNATRVVWLTLSTGTPTTVLSTWAGTYSSNMGGGGGTITNWKLYSDNTATGTWVDTSNALSLSCSGIYTLSGGTFGFTMSGTAAKSGMTPPTSYFNISGSGTLGTTSGTGSFGITLNDWQTGDSGTWSISKQ